MKKYRVDVSDVNRVDYGLWTIGKLFEQTDFEEIQREILAVPPEQYVASPANPETRFELTWALDGVLENLTETFAGLANHVSYVTGIPVFLTQVRVWKDVQGFRIPFHEDDQSSAAHIQIYISDNRRDLGTTWYTRNGRVTLPFVPNTGYLTVCGERLPHGMLTEVTGEPRYSLYATFAKAP